MKDAKPDRYRVERFGTPDPLISEYYVLDVVHDMDARVALRGLVNKYRFNGPSVKADELEQLLNETDKAFGDLIRSRQQQQTPAKRGRPRSARSIRSR